MSEASRRSLLALVRAWPIRAAPFGQPIAPLTRRAPRQLDNPTAALRSDLTPHAQTLARGHSLDALDSLIEQTWFPARQCVDRDRSTLADYLAALAEHMLEVCGPVVRLASRPPQERSDHADAWRRLSLFLPADLLIAARCSDEPTCDHVTLLDPLLARVLESHVAETHLHVGAGMDFSVLWSAVLHDLAWGPELRRDHEFVEDGLGGGAQHTAILRAAMLARHAIFMFAWHRSEGACTGDFLEFLREWLPRSAQEVHGSRDPGALMAAYGATWSLLHVGPLHEPSDVTMRSALRGLAGGRRPKIADTLGLIRADPAARWLVPGEGRARPETRLLWHALRYLRGPGRSDEWFARVFWQYVRVRTLVFGRLVEAPGTAGLDWFTRHYDRIKHYRGVLDEHPVDAACTTTSRGIGLGSIEVRTAPRGVADNRRWVRTIAKQSSEHARRGAGRLEAGLVLHFIKSGDASPDARVYATRHGRWFSEQLRLARGITALLDAKPEMLAILRGVDVAARELVVPNWPLVPLLAKVREHGRRAALALARRQPKWQLEGIRITLHLGEEFRRLSDGLRRIHEAVQFGLLGVGDRIGHGLALGWDVRKWAERHPRVSQPREERLDDLLWMLDRFEARDIVDHGQCTALRAEAHRHIRAIYGSALAIDELQVARRDRFNLHYLERLDYPQSCRTTVPRDLELLHRHLTDDDVYRRGAEPIEVKVDEDEVAFLERIQAWLRQQLALLGTTIESNPTSNLMIGDFPDLRQHPTFRLSPLSGSDARRDGRLAVSLNTDDPITFATCLADEYAHMYFALIGQGVATRDALAWLDQAREAGWRSRFTERVSGHPEVARMVAGERP